ncbi:hypothetical protein [Paenibacillus glacialis]|uniref:Uncharacterized protein n=1 Tax=Paenibacillus glacialis TaxID=494026 RepID=A0A168HQW9_9BACL|nr:hypothetical protein [Paenibacillus glacialis]OAB38437.1 hypothetical protein PGLA_20305 [Paenibacillus glacialis]
MKAVIVSEKVSMYVRQAIGNVDVSFEKVGLFTETEFLTYSQSAAQINIQTFITDADCTDPKSFIEGINRYRTIRYNTRIIVIALDRYEDDATIHQLADMGIEVITTSPGTNGKSIIPALKRLIPDQVNANTPEQDLETSDFEMQRIKDKIYRYTSKLQTSSYFDSADIMKMDLPDLPIQERIIVQDRIIGTISVAVMGVESKIGSTHQSILIANYLQRKGYSVAIVEASQSNDFNSIEFTYEGMRNNVNHSTNFSIEGVQYYKSNSQMEMSSLVASGYDYLILDIGNYEDSDWSVEFYRANVQIVVGAGSEWRQPKIKQFRELHKHMDQSNWSYCIPIIEKLGINDIRKALPGNQVFRIPSHADPYKSQNDTDSMLNKILQKYMGEKKKAGTRNVLYGIIGSCVIVIVVLVIVLLYKI